MLLANEALASPGAHVKGMPLAQLAYALQGAHVKGVSSSLDLITNGMFCYLISPCIESILKYIIRSTT